jgi:hypothetical protein
MSGRPKLIEAHRPALTASLRQNAPPQFLIDREDLGQGKVTQALEANQIRCARKASLPSSTCLRRDQQARDGGGILQGGSHDLGRVNDALGEHVAVGTRLNIVAPTERVVFENTADDQQTAINIVRKAIQAPDRHDGRLGPGCIGHYRHEPLCQCLAPGKDHLLAHQVVLGAMPSIGQEARLTRIDRNAMA